MNIGSFFEGGSGPSTKSAFFYSGTERIYNGYVFCADQDHGTAATRTPSRNSYIEKPSTTNLHRFRGVACDLPTGGRVGPCLIPLFVPDNNLVDVFTDATCVIDTTDLFIRPASWYISSYGTYRVGLAGQTVDRSSTAGVAQAWLNPVDTSKRPVFAARSRTAVQLPTAAIWDNFPLEDLRRRPGMGSLLVTDFTGDTPWFNSFIDATYAAAAAGKTPTEQLYPGVKAIGEMLMLATTDHQGIDIQFPAPIVVSGGNKWAFGVRIKQSVITNTKGNWFAGLMLGQALVGDLIADAGTLQASGSLGFQCKEGDGDKIDLVYDETGQSQNEHDPDYVTQEADTYNVLEMYFNGETVQAYIDGVLTGTAIIATDISVADFPTAKVFVPTLALKNAHADDFTVTVDWMMAAQIG